MADFCSAVDIKRIIDEDGGVIISTQQCTSTQQCSEPQENDKELCVNLGDGVI